MGSDVWADVAEALQRAADAINRALREKMPLAPHEHIWGATGMCAVPGCGRLSRVAKIMQEDYTRVDWDRIQRERDVTTFMIPRLVCIHCGGVRTMSERYRNAAPDQVTHIKATCLDCGGRADFVQYPDGKVDLVTSNPSTSTSVDDPSTDARGN